MDDYVNTLQVLSIAENVSSFRSESLKSSACAYIYRFLCSTIDDSDGNNVAANATEPSNKLHKSSRFSNDIKSITNYAFLHSITVAMVNTVQPRVLHLLTIILNKLSELFFNNDLLFEYVKVGLSKFNDGNEAEFARHHTVKSFTSDCSYLSRFYIAKSTTISIVKQLKQLYNDDITINDLVFPQLPPKFITNLIHRNDTYLAQSFLKFLHKSCLDQVVKIVKAQPSILISLQNPINYVNLAVANEASTLTILLSTLLPLKQGAIKKIQTALGLKDSNYNKPLLRTLCNSKLEGLQSLQKAYQVLMSAIVQYKHKSDICNLLAFSFAVNNINLRSGLLEIYSNEKAKHFSQQPDDFQKRIFALIFHTASRLVEHTFDEVCDESRQWKHIGIVTKAFIADMISDKLLNVSLNNVNAVKIELEKQVRESDWADRIMSTQVSLNVIVHGLVDGISEPCKHLVTGSTKTRILTNQAHMICGHCTSHELVFLPSNYKSRTIAIEVINDDN